MSETMLSNILDEKRILKKIIKDFITINKNLIEELKHKKLKKVLVLATGSSINAIESVKYFMQDVLKMTMDVKEPFNYLNYEIGNKNFDMVIAISQSGRSSSTIEALKYIKNNFGTTTLSITADSNSPIVNYSDFILNLNMGIEKVGFVTKGFSATILNLILMSINLSKEKNYLQEELSLKYIKDLKKVVNLIPSMIEKTENYISMHKEIFIKCERFVCIGYGSLFGIAKEFETKFLETVRCPSQGFELEAYMHGPYLEANKNHVLFYLDVGGPLSERLNSLKNYMANYTKLSVVISTKKVEEELNINVPINEIVSESFLTILTVVPIQLLSYRIANLKGINLERRIFDDFDKVLKSKII